MVIKALGVSIAVICLVGCGLLGAAQGQEKRTGKVIGEIKTKKDTPNGNNTILEVLAPGEEKPRSYHVQYDPKIKGPVPSLLKAVRAAKVGDRVELEWVATNHGPAITAFQVLKPKAPGDKDKN